MMRKKPRRLLIMGVDPPRSKKDEVAKALRYYRKRLKTAREYQRGYYARNRTKILQQRKQRAERER